MILSCFLVDDEAHALEMLAALVLRTPGLQLAGKATDPLAALQQISAGPPPDIVFLDVDMPGLSGLDLAGLIDKRSTIVFTTAYREYAVEAFEREAADYLLKPIFYERFLGCIQRIRRLRSAPKAPERGPEIVLLNSGIKGQFRSIAIGEIIYARAMLNYIDVRLAGDQHLMTYLNLSQLLARLPAGGFSRIHKSYLVSHGAIRTLEYGQVRLKNGEVLPIGRTFREDFRKTMNAFLVNGAGDD